MNGKIDADEAETLIQGYADDSLTEQESARLLVLLRQEPSKVDLIIQALRDDCLIRKVVAESMTAPATHPQGSPLSTPQFLRRFRLIMTWPGGKGWVKPSLGLAACLVVAAAIGVLWFGPRMGDPVLAEVTGAGLSLERAGQTLPSAAGRRLRTGDVLRTLPNATAAITFAPEKTRIVLQSDTELKLVSVSRGKRFAVRTGQLVASVARQRPFRPMVIVTPQAEARVLGTKFTLAAATNATRLEVIEGKVKLTRTSDGAPVEVDAGYYAVATDSADLVASPLTGRILCEYWTGISGDTVGMLTTHTNYPGKPSRRDFLNRLEEPTNWSGSYGTRTRGYLYPPKTGQYRFWIAADDSGELYLSMDDSPDQKDLIASVFFRSKPREWTKYPWQQSSPIKLMAGHGYYIEVLHKKNVGTGHLAVAWQTPGGKREIIPGACLAPLKTEK
jgi:FecR-like protein/PA14 domain-containing protein